MRSDPGFLRHLQRSNTWSEIFQEGSAVEFVDQLYRRWRERHPTATRERKPAPEPPLGAIYISFADEDREVVKAIANALSTAGLNIWLGGSPLLGESFSKMNEHIIRHCALFMPILSRQTLTPEARFFRSEWHYALRVAEMMPLSRRFIVPIVIDETSPAELVLPEQFRMLHWARLDPDRIDPELVAHLKDVTRNFRSPDPD